jgi:hypothetical protein
MIPIISPIELKNVGGSKLKYSVDETEIKKYNAKNDDFNIFKLENVEGSLGPGEIKYIRGHFRPLTNKFYKVTVPIAFNSPEIWMVFEGPILTITPGWIVNVTPVKTSKLLVTL